MGLQVWIPGVKDFSDQGLAGEKWTNNNVTINSSGKLGSCLSFAGNGSLLNNSSIFKNSLWSISSWLYTTTISQNQCFVCTRESLGAGVAIFFISGSLRVDCGSIDTSGQKTFNYTIPVNTWIHICVVHEESRVVAYINGQEIGTRNHVTDVNSYSSYTTIGASQVNNSSYGNNWNGKMNDIRIYDHALSPREVKHLAQGLVLHYPLNRGGFGADNLLYVHNHNIFHQTNNASTYPINRQWLFENGIEYERITRTSIKTNPTVFSIYGYVYKNALDSSITAGMEVTVSVWVRCSHNLNNAYLTFYEVGKTSIKGAVTPIKANQWTKLSLTTTLQKSYSDYSDTGRVVDISVYGISIPSGEISNFYFDFRQDYKMELGTLSTPWTPNQSDDLYSQMGLDNNIEYDVSGYGNNGTKNGVFTYDSDTPKYNTSTIFNGSDNCIKFPFNDFCTNGDVFTMNIWWKKTALGTKGYETLIGGPGGFEMDTRAGSAQALSLYMASTRGGTLYSPFNMNEWYMITLVNDGTNELYYVNGVLVKTIEKKNMPTGNYYVGAWQTEAKQNFQGNMSDFRIYKTPLSPEDVRDLYAVGASLSNTGVLFSNEVSEV